MATIIGFKYPLVCLIRHSFRGRIIFQCVQPSHAILKSTFKFRGLYLKLYLELRRENQ